MLTLARAPTAGVEPPGPTPTELAASGHLPRHLQGVEPPHGLP